jgi:predicted transcriptional regulator
MATSLKIDDPLKRRIQALAAARKRSPHWIMHEAIEQYVEREEARESFRQEALAAWTEYQETGLHLTHEEVRSWLGRWGTDGASEPAECHE